VISYIVSAYDRPDLLACCLGSLAVQADPHEIIVCDNHPPTNRRIADWYGARYRDTSATNGQSCYHGLEVDPMGDWLCFPSADSYYVPGFARIMLQAAQANGWEFVYCDVLYDPRLAAYRGAQDEYSVLDVAPEIGRIDKTGFLVTARAFASVGGWPPHPLDFRDGALAERLVATGIRHGKAKGPMVVHN
jgi:GT2 family glycosyltransferase